MATQHSRRHLPGKLLFCLGLLLSLFQERAYAGKIGDFCRSVIAETSLAIRALSPRTTSEGRSFLIERDLIHTKLVREGSSWSLHWPGGAPIVVKTSPSLSAKLEKFEGSEFIAELDSRQESLDPTKPLRIKRFWPNASDYHWEIYASAIVIEERGEFAPLSHLSRQPMEIDGRRWENVDAFIKDMEADDEEEREERMRIGLAAKYASSPLHVRLLLSTEDRRIVFHTAEDEYWGDGWDGSGKNRLGYLLEELRAELREQSIQPD